MAPRKFPEKKIGQFMFDQFEGAFTTRVLAKKEKIDAKVDEVYKNFFDEMAGYVGGQSAPRPVSAMGIEWGPNSPEWTDQKKSKMDDFYAGLGRRKREKRRGKSYLEEIKSRSVEDRYGDVEVNVTDGKRGAKYNPKSRRFHYRGRFISASDVGVQVRIDAFPLVKKNSDLARGFSPRVRNILSRNEPWGRKYWGDKAARPFLTPMVEYYSQVKLPRAVTRALST